MAEKLHGPILSTAGPLVEKSHRRDFDGLLLNTGGLPLFDEFEDRRPRRMESHAAFF